MTSESPSESGLTPIIPADLNKTNIMAANATLTTKKPANLAWGHHDLMLIGSLQTTELGNISQERGFPSSISEAMRDVA
jgi:hypothetical protein